MPPIRPSDYGLFLDFAIRCKLADVSKKIITIELVPDAGEQHLDTWQLLLRVGDVFLEDRLLPYPPGLPHGLRVVIARFGARLTADHTVEIRADIVFRARANFMARRALLLKYIFPGVRILRDSNRRQRQQHTGCNKLLKYAQKTVRALPGLVVQAS